MAGRRLRSKALIFCASLLASLPAPRACDDAGGETVRVRAVTRLGDLTLEDGRTVRLAGILWPSQPRDRVRLSAVIAAHVLHETVRLTARGAPDRWGRIAADLHVDRGGKDALWVQGELAEEGQARLWPERAARPCWTALHEREYLARQARIGVWAALAMRPARLPHRRATPMSERVIFVGDVRSVRQGRSVTFVNFAGPFEKTPSWLISRQLAEEFRRIGRDPATFAGQRLMLRGTYRAASRPVLSVDVPEAVDILE